MNKYKQNRDNVSCKIKLSAEIDVPGVSSGHIPRIQFFADRSHIPRIQFICRLG